jgi:hypothetical protein
VRRLKRLGERPRGGAGFEAYRQPFVVEGQSGANLLAVIRGRELPDEYVILGAHYDHLGTHSNAMGECATSFPSSGAICNGATDNAAGVAAVLGAGRAIRRLPTPPRRSVILALWDAEEDGLLGSLHYVNDPLVPLASTRAYINFDIQGADLLPSLSHSTFAVSPETGGSPLQAFVAEADLAEPALDVRPLSYIFGQGRSDYANFVAKGVPTVFLGDGTNGCYHTVEDDIGIVDKPKLAAQARLGYRLAVALAETPTPPPRWSCSKRRPTWPGSSRRVPRASTPPTSSCCSAPRRRGSQRSGASAACRAGDAPGPVVTRGSYFAEMQPCCVSSWAVRIARPAAPRTVLWESATKRQAKSASGRRRPIVIAWPLPASRSSFVRGRSSSSK